MKYILIASLIFLMGIAFVSANSIVEKEYTDMVMTNLWISTKTPQVGGPFDITIEIENQGNYSTDMWVELGFQYPNGWYIALLIDTVEVYPGQTWTYVFHANYPFPGEWTNTAKILGTRIHDTNLSNHYKEITYKVRE